jgi:hypothetical protein
MQLEVRVVFRVRPEDAPFMVAKIGSVDCLIQNVMHPLVNSMLLNLFRERLGTGNGSENGSKVSVK